jgi:hypothetical protein
VVAGWSLGLAAPAGAQLAAGHVDTFQDGTTQGWGVNLIPGFPNHPAPPQNIANGGPTGAGDRYLQLTAVGGTGVGQEPGSKLTSINLGGAWAGNYLTAGVAGIRLDAINLGTTDLFLRLLFENPVGGPPTDLAASATPWLLPANSGWRSFFFPIFGPGGLVALQGNLTTLLENTTAIRIYNSPTLAENGPAVVARLGVDNVTAVATPEPSTVILLGAGALGIFAHQRRRRG